MGPGRLPRTRASENDENSATTRITRNSAAKAAALDAVASQKVAPAKKTTTGKIQSAAARQALTDLSNVVAKPEGQEGKKPAVKAGLKTKAAAGPTGVQKNTSIKSTSQVRPVRPALGARTTNGKVEPKRAGSGAVLKRKPTASSTTSSSVATVKDEELELEGGPARKQARVAEPKAATASGLKDKRRLQRVKDESGAKDEEEKEDGTEAADAEQRMQWPYDPRTLCTVPDNVMNLSLDDFEDPLMVAEYADEIFDYLLQLESKEDSQPSEDYMLHQDDLEWKTRGILVDWLIEVHTRFHLVPETLFLAVNIVDRFLSLKVVQLDRLQLVGITAMFIASKYEEVMSPHVSNFRHVTDDGFSEEEILSAERFILSTLNYNLSYPNPMNFLRRVSKADNYDPVCRTVGKYLMEISLLDHRFLHYRPSRIAAAAMALARLILDRGEWDSTLAFYSGYTEQEVMPVVTLMVDYLSRPISHEAFFKKYASRKFCKASLLSRTWVEENGYIFGIESSDVPVDNLE